MADRTIVELDVIATADALAAGLDAIHFEVQIDGISSPESRQLDAEQIQELLLVRAAIERKYNPTAKAGTTAGWVVGAANNLGKMATLPQNQTGSTLVIPLPELPNGWTITGFYLTGSLQSAGNACSISADLRSLTAAAAGATDASVGSMAAPLSVTANTVVSSANAAKTGLTEVIAVGKSYYLLITSTSGASCTQELQAVTLQLTSSIL